VGRISLREFCGEFGAKLGIYLHPERYGQGIGTEAMRQFLAIAPVECISLDVAVDNQRAIRCYQKVGFQFVTASNPIIMLVATRLGRERMEERYASFAATMSHAFSSTVR
jgi:ribosomal protein S18 acetylase RimI-like enzyme